MILVVGFFALLGTFFGVQIDALFVTAMLTIIGFSVHDTIVVFDRVRENRARHAGEPFADIVNHSILQTFGRSITTSLTVVLTLLALLLFGGSAINDFILALLIGIVSGTYSSIFVASPLLVDWHLWEDRRHGRVATPAHPEPAAPFPDRIDGGARQSRSAATDVRLMDVLEPRFRWVLPGPRRGPADASAAATRHGLSDRVAGLLVARGVPDGAAIDAFFGEPLDGLHDAALLPESASFSGAWPSRATRGSACSSSATSTRTA